MTYSCTVMPSPVGRLTLVATHAGLSGVLWPSDNPFRVRLGPMDAAPDHPVLREARDQLDAYFAGSRTAFDLPLDATGTDFQKKVWAALLRIPYGQTRSYRDIAREIGQPTATRAVGAANGRNPISIVVPCHRVIGATGALTGFGGGLDAKEKLLAIEGHRPETKPVVTRRRQAASPDEPGLPGF